MQKTLVLYTSEIKKLLKEIDDLISLGAKIDVVTNLSKEHDANIWLVIFTPEEERYY